MAKKAARPLPAPRHIPNADHIARYCAPVNLDAAGCPTGAAFQLRTLDRGRLSCDWVECLSGPPPAAQAAALRRSLSRVGGYNAAGKIGILNAGDVRALELEAQRLAVVHAPGHRNTCHAVIEGTAGLLELTFAELLADLTAASAIRAG